MDPASLGDLLRRAGLSDVRTDSTTRAAYSSDASLYRATPAVVARPRDAGEVAAALAVCREHGIPLIARGAGTSIAGNAVGTGLVLDFSRHMHGIVEVDPDARTATVRPGVVLETLQRAAAPHGLRFGPDPSSANRATVGGMIGNNACGTRALGYGRTSDNVLALAALTGSGKELRVGAGVMSADGSGLLGALDAVTRAGLGTIRTEFGRFGRQVSGYALEHLLPERGGDVARLLVGSEGTLAVVTEATLRLCAAPPHRLLVALGYPDVGAAGDATPGVLEHGPVACEGIDARIVDVVRARRGPAAVPDLPRGAAWLFVELAGDEPGELARRAARLTREASALDARTVTDSEEADRLWRIRADGAGLSGRSPAGLPAHAGWEDAAVPPERLGPYLREFDALLAGHGLTGLPYGHFGDGCLHIRIDFPLDRPGGATVMREFVDAAATLALAHGGSLSGEHGDGRARSELLSRMYSPAAIDLFGAVKHAFDPDGLLNPGVLTAPRPLDADLRVPAATVVRRGLALAYRHDGGDFTRAVHRCTGIGLCRRDDPGTGVMCPSYLATREERDSTRGRARVLQEMLNGGLKGGSVTGGWRAPEVREALDLCLSCKGCMSDCPTGTDMAAYKAEVLHQAHRHRLRPLAHYSLGWLPRWARFAALAPGAVNAAARRPALRSLALRAAGIDPRRGVPTLASNDFRRWFAARPRSGGRPVTLFVDTFTEHFAPEVGRATVVVLEAAGYQPRLSPRGACCALTWISTGQLDAARRILRRTVAALGDAPADPIVAMEPSCTAVLRSDAGELLGPAADPVGERTRTLAELLTDSGWRPPPLTGRDVVAQPHCHHHAVMGWDADARLLAAAGARVRRLGGCCGLAGNFGMERGHYDVSVAVADQQLRPAVLAATPETTILTDGFSCRTQLADLTDRRGTHLAQLLAAALPASAGEHVPAIGGEAG